MRPMPMNANLSRILGIELADAAYDLQVNTQKCSDAYETMIRRHPEQWAWMHKRWKTKPKV